jgi:hypothetical protein
LLHIVCDSPKMRGSSREEPCNDGLFWYNISFKQRFIGCYAKENSTVRELWHGTWAPALVQSHHNSMTVVPYLKDVKSVMGPYLETIQKYCLYFFHACPITQPRCVQWWPDTSWCYPDTNFMSYYTHPLDMFLTWPEPVEQDPKFGFGHHLSFSQNDELGQGPTRRKRCTQL